MFILDFFLFCVIGILLWWGYENSSLLRRAEEAEDLVTSDLEKYTRAYYKVEIYFSAVEYYGMEVYCVEKYSYEEILFWAGVWFKMQCNKYKVKDVCIESVVVYDTDEVSHVAICY
jgi:hypothetical protein